MSPACSSTACWSKTAPASARAVGHLLDIGHTRIAVLAGDRRNYTGRERLEGYVQAMRERDVEIPPEYIVAADWSESRGYAAMLRLLSLENPPTAIFGCNYNMTVGALGLLKEHGYRVPDDISVASFDDVPLFRLHEAGITAVAQPIERIAETITQLMVSRLSEEGALHAPHTIMLGCDTILRGSTRRPAAAASVKLERGAGDRPVEPAIIDERGPHASARARSTCPKRAAPLSA